MIRRLAALTLAAALLGGCGYFEVTDPTSGRQYYTIGTPAAVGEGGAITFTDQKSGAKVTLQESEVKPIDQEAYEKAVPPKK